MSRPGIPDHPDAPGVSVCDLWPACVLPRHVRSVSHVDSAGNPFQMVDLNDRPATVCGEVFVPFLALALILVVAVLLVVAVVIAL